MEVDEEKYSGYVYHCADELGAVKELSKRLWEPSGQRVSRSRSSPDDRIGQPTKTGM
jgi:hypothetical protein